MEPTKRGHISVGRQCRDALSVPAELSESLRSRRTGPPLTGVGSTLVFDTGVTRGSPREGVALDYPKRSEGRSLICGNNFVARRAGGQQAQV